MLIHEVGFGLRDQKVQGTALWPEFYPSAILYIQVDSSVQELKRIPGRFVPSSAGIMKFSRTIGLNRLTLELPNVSRFLDPSPATIEEKQKTLLTETSNKITLILNNHAKKLSPVSAIFQTRSPLVIHPEGRNVEREKEPPIVANFPKSNTQGRNKIHQATDNEANRASRKPVEWELTKKEPLNFHKSNINCWHSE